MESFDDPPDHCIQIGILVAAQEVAEIGDVVIAGVVDALTQPLEVEAGSAAVPELEDRERADQIASERTGRDFGQIMEIADLRALAGGANFLGDGFLECEARNGRRLEGRSLK